MTPIERDTYVARLSQIESSVAELNRSVLEKHNQPVGCHWLVQGLAGLEDYAGGLRSAIDRAPVEEEA